MAKKTKPIAPTKAELSRRVLELQAQLASTYAAASASLRKCGTDSLMGSGVLVQLSALGGRQLCAPFVIHDGLSEGTIEHLQREVRRSYDLATLAAPPYLPPPEVVE